MSVTIKTDIGFAVKEKCMSRHLLGFTKVLYLPRPGEWGWHKNDTFSSCSPVITGSPTLDGSGHAWQSSSSSSWWRLLLIFPSLHALWVKALLHFSDTKILCVTAFSLNNKFTAAKLEQPSKHISGDEPWLDILPHLKQGSHTQKTHRDLKWLDGYEKEQ